MGATENPSDRLFADYRPLVAELIRDTEASLSFARRVFEWHIVEPRTWGEALWTARDLRVTTYVVTTVSPIGPVY